MGWLVGAASLSEPAIEILWQSRLVIAVEKPAGIATTAAPGIESVQTRVRDQLSEITYLTPVHRLDRDVGGVLLLAKTKKSARLLSEQFAARKVHKTYLAWVHGEVTAETDTWVDFLQKLPDQARGEVCPCDAPAAKRAETRVELIRYDDQRKGSLLKLHPITGRMHQLRLQTAHRGHPIWRDPIYAEPGFREAEFSDGGPADSLIELLAHRIEFHDPGNGSIVRVELPQRPMFV